jgi:hypothetical protein
MYVHARWRPLRQWWRVWVLPPKLPSRESYGGCCCCCCCCRSHCIRAEQSMAEQSMAEQRARTLHTPQHRQHELKHLALMFHVHLCSCLSLFFHLLPKRHSSSLSPPEIGIHVEHSWNSRCVIVNALPIQSLSTRRILLKREFRFGKRRSREFLEFSEFFGALEDFFSV